MNEETERRRTATHEAAHSVTADFLGFETGPVTIKGGREAWGCSYWSGHRMLPADLRSVHTDYPLTAWPASIREHYERRAIVLMAGITAELLLTWPAIGRQPRTAVERVEALERPTSSELTLLTEGVNESNGGDLEMLSHDADLIHGPLTPSRTAWLEYMQAETDVVVSLNRTKIERLAELLMENESLGAVAVRKFFQG